MNNDRVESFYFNEAIDGFEHNYRITMNEHIFEVERDGRLIAELQHDCEPHEHWKQVSGDELPQNVVETMGDKIESHFC